MDRQFIAYLLMAFMAAAIVGFIAFKRRRPRKDFESRSIDVGSMDD